MDPNQSKNGKYNLISGWFNKISKRFLWFQKHICLCVMSWMMAQLQFQSWTNLQFLFILKLNTSDLSNIVDNYPHPQIRMSWINIYIFSFYFLKYFWFSLYFILHLQIIFSLAFFNQIVLLLLHFIIIIFLNIRIRIFSHWYFADADATGMRTFQLVFQSSFVFASSSCYSPK